MEPFFLYVIAHWQEWSETSEMRATVEQDSEASTAAMLDFMLNAWSDYCYRVGDFAHVGENKGRE